MDARTLCLGALQLGDASGYEIKKLYEEGDFSHFYETSFGSIYPALNRLVEDGLAVCTEQAQDKRPDKKVYSITAKGRQAFAEALQAAPTPDKFRSDFCFMMVFAHLLPVNRLAQLLDRQAGWYGENIRRMEGDACAAMRDASAAQRFIHGLGLAVYRTAADYLARHKEALLAEAEVERSGTDRAA
jgi:PadR family transcriptional regulator, regulatory protein AphA